MYNKKFFRKLQTIIIIIIMYNKQSLQNVKYLKAKYRFDIDFIYYIDKITTFFIFMLVSIEIFLSFSMFVHWSHTHMFDAIILLTLSCLKKQSIFSSLKTRLLLTRLWKTFGSFFKATLLPSLGSVTALEIIETTPKFTNIFLYLVNNQCNY